MAAAVDITPKQDGGVLKIIKREGKGTSRPSVGTTVRVHYVGTLEENGSQFDSSRDRNQEFEFLLGREQVIKGWDIGVATMRQGELADFTIRSDYAYGDAGSPPRIPGGVTLKFEVELLGWQAEDISPERDGSICRTVIQEGEKLANPNETSTVQVHVVGKHEGRVFYDKDLSYTLGECSEVGLPEGVDRALRRFCRGEKSVIDLKGTRFTYGDKPPAEFNLPPNAPLQFTMFLKDFEKVPATWEMTSVEKLDASKAAKEQGTAFLQQNKFKLAFDKYKRIEQLLEYEKSMDPEQKKERDALILAAYLNMALVASKMDENLNCIKYCDKALECDPKNVKAIFRKATAKLASNDIKEAKQLFEKVIEIDSGNKAAQQQILLCKQKMKEIEEADKRRYKKLFAKIHQEEEEDEKMEINAGDTVHDDAIPSTSTAPTQLESTA